MADKQILVTGSADAPAGYTVPNTAEIIPKALSCVFDGTGASGDFVPVLEIVSDGGVVVAQSKGSTVTAGGSVEQTWFPRVGGTSTATPAASAYLETQTSKTFTGSVGFDATWEFFNTTDTTVFGTNLFASPTTLPPHNTTGDVNLVLLQKGCYVVECAVQWHSGQTDFFAELGHGNTVYQTGLYPSPIEALASSDAPGGIASEMVTQSIRLFTVEFPPGYTLIQMQGVGATTYTVDSYSMVAHWLGGGVGADTSVY